MSKRPSLIWGTNPRYISFLPSQNAINRPQHVRGIENLPNSSITTTTAPDELSTMHTKFGIGLLSRRTEPETVLFRSILVKLKMGVATVMMAATAPINPIKAWLFSPFLDLWFNFIFPLFCISKDSRKSSNRAQSVRTPGGRFSLSTLLSLQLQRSSYEANPSHLACHRFRNGKEESEHRWRRSAYFRFVSRPTRLQE